jgi:hypothetical protein
MSLPNFHYRKSSYLNSSVYWSDEEIKRRKKYLTWEEISLNWENVHLTWDEVFILLEIGSGAPSGMKEYVDGNPWMQTKKELGEEKTKKLIKLYCRVKGIDYEETKSPIDDIKVSVNEFERFIKDAISIKVDF